MLVELTEDSLRDAFAVAGEWDADGARSPEATLEWLGWEGGGPMLLRRYDVQLFVWYTLPRKFLTSLEHKREAAEALARTLERFSGRAASYAEVAARTRPMSCCAPGKTKTQPPGGRSESSWRARALSQRTQTSSCGAR